MSRDEYKKLCSHRSFRNGVGPKIFGNLWGVVYLDYDMLICPVDKMVQHDPVNN